MSWVAFLVLKGNKTLQKVNLLNRQTGHIIAYERRNVRRTKEMMIRPRGLVTEGVFDARAQTRKIRAPASASGVWEQIRWNASVFPTSMQYTA